MIPIIRILVGKRLTHSACSTAASSCGTKQLDTGSLVVGHFELAPGRAAEPRDLQTNPAPGRCFRTEPSYSRYHVDTPPQDVPSSVRRRLLCRQAAENRPA